MKVILGNIFRTEMQTVVNTVNCFGVMGAGLALECKYRYPDMFVRYKDMCDKKLLDIGKLYLYKTSQKWILNFPTKYHWKYETKPEYLESGLKKILEIYKSKGIESIAFPLLGAHNGGLTKEKSLEIMGKYLSVIGIPVEVYQFDPNSPDDIFENFKKAFQTTNILSLTKMTGLKDDKINKLLDVLKDDEIHNMGQLANYNGIGESTLQKCFAYAMRSDTLNIQLNLF